MKSAMLFARLFVILCAKLLTNMPNRRKVVLDYSTEPSLVYAAINKEGFNVFQEFLATDKSPYEVIWSCRSLKGAVHFIVDDLINIDYLIFDEVSLLSTQNILSNFHAFNLKDILELQINKDKDTDAFILSGIGILGSREVLHEIIERLSVLAKSESSAIRLSVIVASSYLAWPELIPILEYIIENDTEDFVKWRAQQTIKALEESAN